MSHAYAPISFLKQFGKQFLIFFVHLVCQMVKVRLEMFCYMSSFQLIRFRAINEDLYNATFPLKIECIEVMRYLTFGN